jgi:hypothetical protein
VFTWPDGDMSQLPHKLPKVSTDQMAVVDGLGNGIQFGPGDLKMQLQRGEGGACLLALLVASVSIVACPSMSGGLCSAEVVPFIGWQYVSCIHVLTNSRRHDVRLLCFVWCCASCSLGKTSDCTPAACMSASCVCCRGAGSPTRATCKLIDYQRLPGGGKSLFNTAGVALPCTAGEPGPCMCALTMLPVKAKLQSSALSGVAAMCIARDNDTFKSHHTHSHKISQPC